MFTKGGGIKRDNIFNYIKSIGFEIETTDLIKFTITQEDDKEIMVNSALANVDLDYGLMPEDEYSYVIDTKDLQFKITNDSAEDTYFNEEMKKISDKVDCEETVFKLSIPRNRYLTQDEYDIKFLEDDSLVNCSSFADVEWVITHYKPAKTPNVILETFKTSMQLLSDHLHTLVTIPNSHLLYLDNDFVKYENTSINQTYVLPNTSLVYFNSIYTNTDRGEIRSQNYDITQNLEVVAQMTFSCDILHIYRIMKKLLSVDFTHPELAKLNRYLEKYPENKNIITITELIGAIENGENDDLHILMATLNIVKTMFDNYNSTSKYPFPSNETTKKIQMCFFLIFYKIYIYLNFYLSDPKELFKKLSSFMVRHTNYVLYLEIKKLLHQIFVGKSEREILKIIEKLVVPIDKNKNFRVLFIYEFMDEKVREKYMATDYRSAKQRNIGDPLYSFTEYFLHFEKDVDEEERDWLVVNNVDVKSTKYPLESETVIIEFRDFPMFCYTQLLIEGSEKMGEELLRLNIGVFSMKIINEFIKGKKSHTPSHKTRHASYPRTKSTKTTRHASYPRTKSRKTLKRHTI